jgi:hypothetical protein
VRRGLTHPRSLHDASVRNATVGHIYDVVLRGRGAMPSYAAQIPVHDRWAIVAYVRALQFSQSARIEDATPSEKRKLEEEP